MIIIIVCEKKNITQQKINPKKRAYRSVTIVYNIYLVKIFFPIK
jgi:hypothetical protein